jgi:hypothetical protein
MQEKMRRRKMRMVKKMVERGKHDFRRKVVESHIKEEEEEQE